VGLALDSSNFAIEDQNRAQGRYVVEYRNPVDETKETGFFSRMAFWKGKSTPQQGVRYQVRLAGQGSQTLVVIQNAEGQPDDSPTAQQILTTLMEAIK
jgi:outer membrane protein assembly factor BamC